MCKETNYRSTRRLFQMQLGWTATRTRSSFCAFEKKNQMRDVDVIKTRSYQSNSKIKYSHPLAELAQGALSTATALITAACAEGMGFDVDEWHSIIHSANRFVLGFPYWEATRLEWSGEIFQEDR